MGNPVQVRNINKWLKEQYGKDLLNRPIFRIVWSEDEIEKRAGIFPEFCGPIFLREFRGVKEVKKYASPVYKDRFILEKLIFGINNPELWGDSLREGSYEPIWVFRGPGDVYQLPTMKTTHFIMRMLLNEKVRRNQAMEDSDDAEAMQQEIRDAEEALGVGGDAVASHLHTGSGVTVG